MIKNNEGDLLQVKQICQRPKAESATMPLPTIAMNSNLLVVEQDLSPGMCMIISPLILTTVPNCTQYVFIGSWLITFLIVGLAVNRVVLHEESSGSYPRYESDRYYLCSRNNEQSNQKRTHRSAYPRSSI